MPTVGGKTFGYKPEDISAAERYAAETGMEVEYEEIMSGTDANRNIQFGRQTPMYKKIKAKKPPYTMNGHTLPGIKQK